MIIFLIFFWFQGTRSAAFEYYDLTYIWIFQILRKQEEIWEFD